MKKLVRINIEIFLAIKFLLTVVERVVILGQEDIMTMQNYMNKIGERSGNVTIDCKLTSFFYALMRDYVQPGDVEGIMLNHMPDDPVEYSNGWPAKYTEDIAKRLKEKSCCPEGKRYEQETGAHSNDHPGNCVDRTNRKD